MKRLKLSYAFFALLLGAALTGCSKDEIVFDHELPQFPTREGYQLLEVIMPQGTSADDQLYICGPFNGGVENAVGDPRWQLEKAAGNDIKWGIYLNPSDFADGKTLADGYTFYSVAQREERTVRNGEIVHYDEPAVGGRLNVTVPQWAAYFDKPLDPNEIIHDGYVVYVVDNSGYAELAMYAWGDAEAFGGWPGMQPTGHVTKDGVDYTYFDTTEANKGLNLNLIFNNNGSGSQLRDYNVTLDKDYYLELTPEGVVPFDPSNVVVHDGAVIFVHDMSGWDELRLYMWGDVNDLNGGWPGMEPTGKQTVNGVEYTYFDLGAANAGLNEHVILNNTKGTQFDDVVVFALDRDVYISLTSKGAKEIDPETYNPGGEVTPDPEPEPGPAPEVNDYVICIEDQTGWDALYLYAWGDTELFGGWPGKQADDTRDIDGITYKVWNVSGSGEVENIILNNNAGTQYDGATVTIDRNYYFTATSTALTPNE